VPIPGIVNDIVYGADGRYLLIAMHELQKVGVFDIREAKVKKYVNVDSSNFFVAGGATRFVIVDAENKTLTRWHYEKSSAYEARKTFSVGKMFIESAVMGMNGEGPLLLVRRTSGAKTEMPLEFYDLEQLTSLNQSLQINQGSQVNRTLESRFRPSAGPNGRQFTLVPGESSDPFCIVRFQGTDVTIDSTDEFTGASSNWERPMALDGSYPMGHQGPYIDRKHISSEFRVSSGVAPHTALCWPSHYWLSLSSHSVSGNTTHPGGSRRTQLAFHLGTLAQPITTLNLAVRHDALPPKPVRDGQPANEYKRAFFNAVEKTLVQVEAEAGVILVKRYDLDKAIAALERPVHYLPAAPMLEFVPGTKLEYDIRVLTNQTGITFTMEAGPDGMTVSPSGKVEWMPGAGVAPQQTAIVRVTDAGGKELFCNLKLSRGFTPIKSAKVDVNSGAVDPSEPRVAVQLPAPFEDIVVGASGRYLLAPLKSVRQIAVIDVKARRIAKLIPTDADDIKVAAGATKFVVASSKGTISRWNFARLEREQTIPLTVRVRQMCMGSSSEGPILAATEVGGQEGGLFVDLATLRPSKIKIVKRGYGVEDLIAASANGQTFTTWRSNSSPSGLSAFLIRGDEAIAKYEHQSVGPTMPSPDGSVIYSPCGTYNAELKPLDGQSTNNPGFAARTPFPAATGNFYLSVPGPKNRESNANPEVTLHVQGTETPILTIPGLVQPSLPKDLGDEDPLLWRRLLYVPQADAVVSIGTALDTIYLQRFVIDEAIQKLTEPYLFVTSVPPPALRPSTRLSYQIEARSLKGGVKYLLDAGPPGAQISPEGVITWTIASNVEGMQTFVVHVSDASNIEIFHTFNIDVNKNAAPASMKSVTTVAATGAAPAAEGAAPVGTTDAPTAEIVDLGRPKTEIVMPGPIDRVCVGGHGQYLVGVIPSLRQVAIVDVRAKKMVKLVPVDDDDVRVAAGATKFVVSFGGKGVLSRYKLATGERELTAAAPDKRIIALAMGCSSEGPLLVSGNGPMVFLDLQSLKPSKIEFAKNQEFHDGGREAAMSADGRVFSFGEGQYSISDKTVSRIGSDQFRSGMGFGVPSADGRVLYTHRGMWQVGGNLIGSTDQNSNSLRYNVPAAASPLYIQFKPKDGDHQNLPLNPTLSIQGETQPILSLEGIEPPDFSGGYEDGRAGPKLWSQRCMLLPNFEAIVTIPKQLDHLIIHKFNLDEELKRTDGDYLFVMSVPPAAVNPRSVLQYQLDARSKRGGVKYRLESGPTGMTVSPTGLVSWQPSGATEEEQVVIIAVSDASDQEVFNTFKFKVDAAAPLTTAVVANSVTTSAPAVAAPEPPTEPAAPPPTTTVAPASPPVAAEPTEPGQRQKYIIKLPGAIGDLCVGGGGRFLVVQMKSLRQVAIIDAKEKRIVKYLAIDDDNARIAAGATKLVVGLAGKNILSRYDLATGNREMSIAFGGKAIDAMAMGANSEGPLLIGQSSHYDLAASFYDVRTLKPASISPDANRGLRFGANVRVSSDGRLFGSWNTGVSPTGVHLVQINGNAATYFNDHTSAGMILPSPDGRVVYTGKGLYSPDAKPLNPSRSNNHDAYEVMIPAASGPLYMKLLVPGFIRQDQNFESKLTLHMQGESLPLLTVGDIELPDMPRDIHPAHVANLGLDRRFLMLPIADAVAMIPQTADKIVLQRFNLDEELAKSEIDYLFVASVPPASVAPGTTLSYQVAAKSKRGGLKFRLGSGPPGMTVSSTGLVTWKAVRGADSEQVVIVSLSDASGQESFHTFKLLVESPASAAGNSSTGSTMARPQATSTGTVGIKPLMPAVPKATASATRPIALPVAKPTSRTWTSRDGAFTLEATLILFADDKVTLLKADGKTIEVALDKLSKTDQNYVRSIAPPAR
jgi:hypothetical protein